MSSRTALVTGATGLLGREIAAVFRQNGWTVKGTGFSRADGIDVLKVDLGSEADVAKVFDEVKPQVVVHSAAQRFPDKVEGDPEGAKALNVAASRSLAALAAARGIFVIYISTDYVFSGAPGQAPYEADAEPGPSNLYGQTKLDGERVVLEEYAKAGKQGSAVVLRVPVLYGHAETPAESAVNVLMDAVWKAQTEGATIKMDHWSLRYPTNTEDVGRVCQDIAAKYLDASDRQSLPQILQFSSEDKMTKYEICQAFGEIMGLSIEGIQANTEGNDPKASVQRPYDCHLSTKNLRDLGISVSTMNFKDWWRRESRRLCGFGPRDREVAVANNPPLNWPVKMALHEQAWISQGLGSQLQGPGVDEIGNTARGNPVAVELVPVPPVPESVSRYRSLRGKSISSAIRKPSFEVYRDTRDSNEAAGGDAESGERSPTDLSESPSRLRRRSKSLSSMRRGIGRGFGGRVSTGPAASVANLHKPIPPLPTQNLPLTPKSLNILSAANTASSLGSPVSAARKKTLKGHQPFPRADPAILRELNRRTAQQNKEAQLREAARERKQAETDEAARLAEEVARLEAETDRILEKQKKLDLARLQAQLATVPSRPSTATTTPTKSKPKRLILDTLPFFSRSKRSSPSSQPQTPQSAPPTFVPLSWGTKSPNLNVVVTLNDDMAFIEHGGKRLELQDAPTSASNAGERRVTVRYMTSTINLPVTTETTPVDIAYATANFVSHSLTPSACVVVECYGAFGLERRLRRYEPVRDIMNSWDRDSENSLLILSDDDEGDGKLLHLSSVPRSEDPPTGFTFQLYHSSQPRKWNKRWVTLMDNGQIFTSKRLESKSTDKESTVLCHLSDFDIYTPTESEKSRHLRPPKKHCYAIKSQQKTNVFSDGQNFVHYFAMEEAALAHRFHELVHGWRSWYLVNKSLDLAKTETASRASVKSAKSMRRSKSVAQSHRTRPSTDQAPYTIGEFQPLINMERFDKPLEEFGKTPLPVAEKASPAENLPKPGTLRKTRTAPSMVPKPAPPESEFLAGGLLGAAYDKRRQEETATAATQVKKVDGPFTEGPSLLNKVASPTSPSSRDNGRSWFPSALEHSAKERTHEPLPRRTSAAGAMMQPRRNGPRPLVSLNDNAADATRIQRPGRGIKAPDGTPLINFASGGTQSSQPMPVMRSNSQAAPSGSASAPTSPSSRTRNRSMSSASRSGSRRYPPEGQPPVPPLPIRAIPRQTTRPGPSAGARDRQPRPQEPLINRAK